jgi:hypothetical protein
MRKTSSRAEKSNPCEVQWRNVDLRKEELINLSQAARLLPPIRNGRPVQLSILVRAITRGVGGHRFEALRLGRLWMKSREALQRWVEAQTAIKVVAPEERTALTRWHAAEVAAAELKSLGL